MNKFFLLLTCLFTTTLSGAQNLTPSQCDDVRKNVINEWEESLRPEATKILEQQYVTHGKDTLKFAGYVFGEKPAEGHSLWISMHGGGGAPKLLNDSQWANQIQLYKPKEGIYVAPRAPWDAWDMWFQKPIDGLMEQLIRTLVVLKQVDPNKVYLLGYSAGGDGVWRLAPRLADHWAAASMMAGHPGDVSLVNLRNLPFMVWCGANDGAYNRNKECAKRIAQLDSLQHHAPDGYLHEGHIVADKGHWMDLEDKAALPWMAQHARNPYPTHIVWQQEEGLRPCFYWLSVPQDEMKRGKRVEVKVVQNEIHILQSDVRTLTLNLNDQLVNLDKKVKVHYKGKCLFSKKLMRTEQTLRSTLNQRNDPCYAFPAQITVNIPE